jgi:7-carboxy-7-deazaguanine synthase
VVLTGGEPLLFPAIARLSQGLRATGHFITVETAGTVWLDDLACDLVSISPKLAHSTPRKRLPEWAPRHEAARWAPKTVRRLIENFDDYQLKFVVRWRDDATLESDLAEIDSMLEVLGAVADDPGRVFLMPECIDRQELRLAYERLLPICVARGNRLGERLHIHIFGHRPGT